ncbi:MAG: CRISPR-associated endonuclease Cas2, partial [Thermofilaceae archaeon]
KLRLKVANFLKRLGFARIQRSAFSSPHSSALLSEVEAGLRKLTRDQTRYDIQVYVISKSSYDERLVISHGYTPEEGEELLL